MGLALLVSGAGAAMAATQVTEKNPGGLVAVGPVNGDYGFPAWYEDSNHTRVELCLDDTNPLCGFLPGDVPNPDVPISFPDNFPEEAFYSLVGSELDLPGGGRAVLTLGLEAAFLNGVQNGDQMVFARQRIVVKDAPASTTLTFKHPYGTITIDTDGTGAGRLVEDVSPAVGNFATPLKGNFGPFLKRTDAPAGYLGNPDSPGPVTGSPLGTDRNAFSVTGGGLDLTTTDFTVQGKISTNSGVTADSAVVNGDMLDVFASSSDGAQLQVEGGSGFETTPMVSDPGTGRFYARIQLASGAVPTQVKVTNLADKPTSSSTVAVSKQSGITITQADYDGANLTVTAVAPAAGGPMKVVGVSGDGALVSGTSRAFALSAPPASVTVRNDLGSATLPVTITGGPAMPGVLAPTVPAPDPGPQTETGGGTGTPAPAALAAMASPANVSATRGTTVQLDGSASTGAQSYRWTQVSGTPVTISNDAVARPTVTVPFYVKTTDTAPSNVSSAGPAVLRLTVTGAVPADGGAAPTASADVNVAVDNDTLTIAAGARHRVGTELRISGTSLINGAAGVLSPATSVVIYDTTTPGTSVKLGTAVVDTLGSFDFRQKPGPRVQVRSVLVQSTRGGAAVSTLATR